MIDTALPDWLKAIGHEGRIENYSPSDQRLIIEGDHLTPGDGLTLRDGRRVIVVVVDELDPNAAPEGFVPLDIHEELVEEHDDLIDSNKTLRAQLAAAKATIKTNGAKP